MSDWPITKLGDVLFLNERRESVVLDRQYRLLGVRLDGNGAFLRETKYGRDLSAPTLSRVETDDFIYSRLFAWRGAFGVVSPALDGAFVSNEFPTFTPIDGQIDVNFLKYWFRLPHVLRQVETDCSGSTPLTRNRYKEKFFLSLEIPLPPLPEQQRIVARIEALAGKIEVARRLRGEAMEEGKQVWAKMAQSAMSHDSDAESIRLGDLVRISSGNTPEKGIPEYWNGHIPWVSPKDMKRLKIEDSIDHVTDVAVNEGRATLHPVGAVLLVVRGMILAHTVPSAVLCVPAAINQDMKALIPSSRVSSEYLNYALWANNQGLLGLIERSTHGTCKLQTEPLLDFEIAVPSLSEQERIVDFLEAKKSQLKSVEDFQKASQRELDALLPAILDRAFKGEL